MELGLYFTPVPDDLIADITDYQSVCKNISVHHDKLPDYKAADIAIIGLTENREAGANQGVSEGANEIRRKFYRLKKGSGRYRIADLGNLSNGIAWEDTCHRIREVVSALLQNGVFPLLIGGSHDLDYGQYQAYQDVEKLISVLNVDACLDLMDGEDSKAAQGHVNKILLHDPNYLFHYSHLAYQSYLVGQEELAMLEQLCFDAKRLGTIRDNMRDIEPVIRDADMLSFDITAIKSTDAPGNVNALPFGLTGEEACQLCWYAGTNEKLSSAGFFEYNPQEDDAHMTTAFVMATMLWYFIEGFYQRKDSINFTTNDYMKYVVSMPADPETVTFYKSMRSEKWWMEVPHPKGQNRYNRNYMVPCSYADYQKANEGELPERWINTYSRLI